MLRRKRPKHPARSKPCKRRMFNSSMLRRKLHRARRNTLHQKLHRVRKNTKCNMRVRSSHLLLMWKGRSRLVRRFSRKRVGRSRRIRVPKHIRRQARVMSIATNIRSKLLLR